MLKMKLNEECFMIKILVGDLNDLQTLWGFSSKYRFFVYKLWIYDGCRANKKTKRTYEIE